MSYSDFVIPVMDPAVVMMMQIFLPGFGIKLSAYYKKGGFCFKTWALGFFQNILFTVLIVWAQWTIILPLAVWLWSVFHGYLVFKASKEMFMH